MQRYFQSVVVASRAIASGARVPGVVAPPPLVSSQVRYAMHWKASRKMIVWMRRKPWFEKNWSLNDSIARRGPPTKTFPDGVPMKRIRKFPEFAGRQWKINTGRRRRLI